jgi:prepilin-type N-terminal cleavage/methylation domain-containing protein
MHKDHGFTLTEVLIATILTLIVLGAGLGAFVDGMRLADTTRIVSETNHGLQAAMSMMVRDFIQTGQGIPTGGVPIPTGGGAVPINRPGPPGAGLAFNPAWTTLPALASGGSLGPVVLGVNTDVVTLMYSDPTLPIGNFPLDAIAADGTSMTVNAATPIGGPDGLRVGDIILFSNPQGNALQMITRLDGTQTVYFEAGDPLNLNQTAAPQGTIINLQNAPGAYPPTTATRIWMVSYYIDSVTDPTLPRLVRQLGAGPRLAIALGVENLQYTYDLVDGTTNPTNVQDPPVANSPNQFRKVHLYMAVRSLETNMYNDQPHRNSIATEASLRSLSFVDRYQ